MQDFTPIYIVIVLVLAFNMLPSLSILADEFKQIEKGAPNIIVDSLGNLLSVPKKILLFNYKVDSHTMSPHTQQLIKSYIEDNPEIMKDVKVRINQFALFGEFKRLAKNQKISWWWRIFPGIPVTLFSSLTGRLLGGDNYNPYTDTVSIYSDIPGVALHELAHATDMTKKKEEGWSDFYALGRILPPVALYQEFVASDEAIKYLRDKEERSDEMTSYNTLYPAYGTYVGGYSGIPYGDAVGAVLGHGLGLLQRYDRKLTYDAIDGAEWSNDVVTDIDKDPLAKSLIEDAQRKEEIYKKYFFQSNELEGKSDLPQ